MQKKEKNKLGAGETMNDWNLDGRNLSICLLVFLIHSCPSPTPVHLHSFFFIFQQQREVYLYFL